MFTRGEHAVRPQKEAIRVGEVKASGFCQMEQRDEKIIKGEDARERGRAGNTRDGNA